MSKSKANNEQPVIDLLVEASPQAAVLIMKRRKLLRTGGSLYVGQLKRLDGRTWLKASMPVDDVSRNPWDLAHETAIRYKRDIGQTPYIEPDRVGGAYDTIDKRERAASGSAGTESFDPLDPLDPRKANPGGFDPMSGMGFDPSDIMRGVMPDLSQFGVPNMHGFGAPGFGGSPGIPGLGMSGPGLSGLGMSGFGVPGRGVNSRNASGRGMSGFGLPGSGVPGASLLGKDIPGVDLGMGAPEFGVPQLGAGLDESTTEPDAPVTPSVPALSEVPGWSDLHPVTARMLTVETAQLLLSQMPGVPPQVHPVSSLRAIAKLSQCSRVLRDVLRRLPGSVDGESGMRPVEPTPPPPKDDGMALELTFSEGDVNEPDCVSMSELAEA
jgi:hypothetical protein